ncbi:probable cytochrome P450 28d1 [Uranotaenia lowii]|uniref:probable cytochrome P450 28d1 n=1 Tax=Uranotaenia lowii TaxID=190385 RepID=UPI00247A1A6A|nr:probable cytochrome P450 28d1 [Uranotaenia lowii]
MVLLTFGLIVLAGVFFYHWLTWNFDYWQKRGIIGPKPTAAFGNFKGLTLGTEHVAYELEKIYWKFKGSANFAGVFRGRSPRLFVLKAETAKDVLIKYFRNFHDNEFAAGVDKQQDPIIGRNPFMQSGDEWKATRGAITPAFTTSRMKALYAFVDDVSGRLVTYLNKNIHTAVDARDLCTKFTVDVVSSCIFATDAQSFTSPKPEIRENGDRLLQPSLGLALKLFIFGSFPKLAKFFNMSVLTKDVEQFFINLMEQAVNFRESSPNKRSDYLDYLINLKNKKEITLVDMAAHGVTFFTDGTETSSLAMTFVLYELAKNQDVQNRLREELESAVNSGEGPQYEVLLELSYLEQIVCETLRLWPPAPFISKMCTEPTELNISDNRSLKIDKEVGIIIPIWCLHHDPEYYENPEAFNPDRFDPAQGGTKRFREKGCFIPFGDGPRQCLGMRFALLQIKRGICEIVRNFRITLDRKTKQPLILDRKAFNSTPDGGIWLRFEALAK